MTPNTELFIATTQSNVESLQAITKQAFAGFERLVELNMDASRAVLNETLGHTQAVLDAKDAQAMLTLQAGFLQSLTEKMTAYGQRLYTVSSGTGADFNQAVEARMAEAQARMIDMVDEFARTAPAGTQPAVAAFKNALNASHNVIESAQSSARKVVEVAESGFKTVTRQGVGTVSKVAKTR